MKGYIWIAAAAAVLVAMVIISTDGICKVFPGFFACTPTNDPESGETITPPSPTKPPIIQISIASSITKKEWLDQAVVAFNAASKKEANLQVDSRPIQVVILLENDPLTGKPRHWNSPTQVAATLKEEIKPTILSPAATTWILKLNKEWRVQNGKEISSGPWQPLLSTPVVIAMWESRAEALGCWPVPEPDCTWERIRDLAVSPEGWGMFGHPEWGRFHFGYAYVGESDVGTQTAVLLCMMGLQKYTDLTVSDVQTTNGCGQAIADVEKAIVHRGTSSPLILAAMDKGGPAFLDAVTTYEKNVIGFNNKYQSRERLVSVYPQDGTVIAEHPFAIMDQAPWVETEQVEAAKVFRKFLLSDGQQQAFLPFGLRPSDPDVPLKPPIDITHGANPDANLVVLEVPDVGVVDQVIEVWKDLKKPANIVLVFDKSGSMGGEKIDEALSGAVNFVKEMGRKDWLFWLPFDGQLYPGTQGLVSDVGEQLQSEIPTNVARGETALYDAIARAYQDLERRREIQGDASRYGIVVLSDGQDTKSRTTIPMLEEMLRTPEGEQAGIQVHTIGIGDDAEDLVLTNIANIAHGGRYWKVKDPKTIEAVYKRIAKYF